MVGSQGEEKGKRTFNTTLLRMLHDLASDLAILFGKRGGKLTKDEESRKKQKLRLTLLT